MRIRAIGTLAVESFVLLAAVPAWVTGDITAPPCEYSETLKVPPNCELWGLGQRIRGDSITCRFDGLDFFVGGINITPNVLEEDVLRAWERDIPRVRELTAQGRTRSEAHDEVARELNCLLASVQQAYHVAGEVGVASVFAMSALVDSVSLGGTYASYWIGKLGELRISYLEESNDWGGGRPRYERLTIQLRAALQNVPASDEALVLVTGGGVWSTRGKADIQAARSQILHAAEQQSVNTLPVGPFRGDAPELYAIIRAARMPNSKGPNSVLQPPAPREEHR